MVANSSISLLTLIFRASAKAFSLSCLSSGRRIVRVDMGTPPNTALGLIRSARESTDLATNLATLSDFESVTIRVRIDLDDDLLDGNARCLASADRLHRN